MNVIESFSTYGIFADAESADFDKCVTFEGKIDFYSHNLGTILLGYQRDGFKNHRTKAVIGMEADNELFYFTLSGLQTSDMSMINTLSKHSEHEYTGICFPFKDLWVLDELMSYFPSQCLADSTDVSSMLKQVPVSLYLSRLTQALEETTRNEGPSRLELIDPTI